MFVWNASWKLSQKGPFPCICSTISPKYRMLWVECNCWKGEPENHTPIKFFFPTSQILCIWYVQQFHSERSWGSGWPLTTFPTHQMCVPSFLDLFFWGNVILRAHLRVAAPHLPIWGGPHLKKIKKMWDTSPNGWMLRCHVGLRVRAHLNNSLSFEPFWLEVSLPPLQSGLIWPMLVYSLYEVAIVTF